MAISYLMIGSNDLARSKRFYVAVIPTIGGKFEVEYAGAALCFRMRDGSRVWINRPYDKQAATPSNGSMIGFDAGSEDAVRAAHAAALASGGIDEGAPGPRPQYGPNFYGGYARDPDGNKLSFVYLKPPAPKT